MMLFRAVKQTDATRLAELRRPGAAPEVQRALSAAAIAQELDSLTPVYPCLVAEIDGQVEACAFAAPLRPESAYQWDVELHIFVSEERRRQGVGSALLLRLMRVLSVQGFLQLCAAVTLPDEASQGFLTACGFAGGRQAAGRGLSGRGVARSYVDDASAGGKARVSHAAHPL